jgi:Replication-relaxation
MKMNLNSEKKPRLPTTRRINPEQLPHFRLTKRDCDIIRTVYEFRVMTTPQIEMLFFSGMGRERPPSPSRCQLRLKLLFHAGYLKRVEQFQRLSEGRKPLLYLLDEHGARLLADLDEKLVSDLDWDRQDQSLSWFFLNHLLATNDMRAAIMAAARDHRWTVEVWRDERVLKSTQMKDYVTIPTTRGKEEPAAIVPDGYFRLRAGEYLYHHFLEVDRGKETGSASTEGAKDWGRKIRAYTAYFHKAGGRPSPYEQRYKTQGGRVLTVTTGERRLANLKSVTEQVGGKGRFWFTTFAKITPQSVLTAPIWKQAGKDGDFPLTW